MLIMKEKICNKCKIPKKLDEFNNNKRSIDGKQRTCRECTKEQHINWYYLHKETQIEKNRKVSKNRKDKYIEYKKECKCNKCNEDRWYVLDFHHKDRSEKEFAISNSYLLSNERFWKEIEKCIPLCRNCHSEFHYLERIKGITIEEYIK